MPRPGITALLALALALGAAGCGGGGGGGATDSAPGATATGDSSILVAQQQAFVHFVAALGKGDARAAWELLSERTQERAGSRERFEQGLFVELERGAGAFAEADGVQYFAAPLDAEVGVGAVAGVRRADRRRTFAAFAAPLRLEDGEWRVAIGESAVRVVPIGPDPGEVVGSATQVAAGVKAPAAISDAAIWVDGRALDVRAGGTSDRDVSVFGQPATPLRPGPHFAVAAARAGGEAGVRAWTFVVRARG